jgi:ADP-heptose:LPS heptosyltransferase
LAEENILVIQLRQLGDILLTTPCLRAIKKERPKAKITFLSHSMGRLILNHNPYVDEHFFYSDDWSKLQEWRLAQNLRLRKFDLVLDFMNNPRSAFYALMSGARERIAFHSSRRFAYTATVPRPKPGNYIVDDKFLLLKEAGFNPTDRKLVLPWSEANLAPLMKLLAEQPVFRDAPIRVIISPTHRRVVRRWSLQSYAQLSDWLQTNWQASVVWLWGPGEEAEIDEGMSYCKLAALKAPKTSFAEMTALIANCDLFIGNSNGPSHVAVAADTPSLQLHGHTSAKAWCPMTDAHQALQAPGFGVEEMPNINGITLSDVIVALEKLSPVIFARAEAMKAKRPILSGGL